MGRKRPLVVGTYGLDSWGMEETHLVIYDLNQSFRVKWEEMGMEEGWGEAM